MGYGTEMALGPAGDGGCVMQPTIYISAIGAPDLFRPRKIRQFFPVYYPDIFRALNMAYAIDGESDTVIDFDEDIGDDDGHYHEPNQRRGHEIAQDGIIRAMLLGHIQIAAQAPGRLRGGL